MSALEGTSFLDVFLFSADILRTKGGGVLHMRTLALFGAKTFVFFLIYGLSARTRGEGVNFSLFFAVNCYGRPHHDYNN